MSDIKISFNELKSLPLSEFSNLCSGVSSMYGLCSLWAVLIGWTLLEKSIDEFIVNNEFVLQFISSESRRINTIHELYQLILKIGIDILSLMDEQESNTYEVSKKRLIFVRDELLLMINQFSEPIESHTEIIGRSHLQILSILLGIEIIVIDDDSGIINTIGIPSSNVVHILLRGGHYECLSLEDDLPRNFEYKYWWRQQWLHKNFVPKPVISQEKYSIN